MFTLALKQFSSNNLFSIFKANWIKFNLFTFFWGGVVLVVWEGFLVPFRTAAVGSRWSDPRDVGLGSKCIVGGTQLDTESRNGLFSLKKTHAHMVWPEICGRKSGKIKKDGRVGTTKLVSFCFFFRSCDSPPKSGAKKLQKMGAMVSRPCWDVQSYLRKNHKA